MKTFVKKDKQAKLLRGRGKGSNAKLLLMATEK